MRSGEYTQEAIEAAKFEFSRRQVDGQSIERLKSSAVVEVAARLSPRLTTWAEDWNNTGRGARVVLIFISVLIVGISVGFAVANFFAHEYGDAMAFPLPIALFGFRFVVFPFWVAWEARKRGGIFNSGLTNAIVFGYFICGIAYLIWKKDKLIVPEYRLQIRS